MLREILLATLLSGALADQSCMKHAVLDFSAAMRSGFHERIDDATHQTTNGTKVAQALKTAFAKLNDDFHRSTHEFTEEYLACDGKRWVQKHACFIGAAGAVAVKVARDVGAWTLNELPTIVTSAGNNVGEHARIAGTLGLNLISMTAACAWQLTKDLKDCI